MPANAKPKSTAPKTPSTDQPAALTADSFGTGIPSGREERLRRFYLLGLKIKQLESDRANLRDGLVQDLGTGSHAVGAWLATIASYNTRRLDRGAAELELGSLVRFEKEVPTLRVDVKPAAATLMEVL